MVMEMYNECIKERCRYITNVIDQTLKEGEVGVIFINPTFKLNLPEDIKVIRMYRFDPSDYLNVWVQKLKLRKTN